MSAHDERRRRLPVPALYDFAATIRPLQWGRLDPCTRIAQGGFWWVARTPTGLGTLFLRRDGTELVATGYGPGAEWVVDRADGVAGLRDDLTGFTELAGAHSLVSRLAHQHQGVRLTATGRVFPRLLRAVYEQKVTGQEAHRAYLATVRHFHAQSGSEPAPGPLADLVPPPDPAAIAASPYWVFHPFGVEQKRADALCRAAAAATALEACPDAASATRRLTSIGGIGAWTAAEVTRTVYGDPDAVSVGDFHTPHLVSWALAGEARAGARESVPGALSPADTRMLQLLEPYRGHRGRVVALLERSGLSAPKFAPKIQIRSFSRY